MAINDILPLKAARHDAIATLKCFGAQFRWLHFHALCGTTLFGSHQLELLPPVWQSVVLQTSMCDAWQRSRMQNLWRVGKNFGPILSRLCTKIHEILTPRRGLLVLSSVVAWLSMACFIQKTFAIKYRSHRKTEQM